MPAAWPCSCCLACFIGRAARAGLLPQGDEVDPPRCKRAATACSSRPPRCTAPAKAGPLGSPDHRRGNQRLAGGRHGQEPSEHPAADDVRPPRGDRPERITVACRFEQGGVSSVLSLTVEPYVPEPNVVALRIVRARAGLLPVPLGRVLDGFRRRPGHAASSPVAARRRRPRGHALAADEDADRIVRIETIELREGGNLRGGDHNGESRRTNSPPRCGRRFRRQTFPPAAGVGTPLPICAFNRSASGPHPLPSPRFGRGVFWLNGRCCDLAQGGQSHFC